MGHYPCDVVLRMIEQFDVTQQDIEELLSLIENEWEYADLGYFKRCTNNDGLDILELHTGGWSGNEDIINAMERNGFLWGFLWWKSERGGHYWFEVKKIQKQNGGGGSG